MRYYTCAEAGRTLGVSPRTIQRWASGMELPKLGYHTQAEYCISGEALGRMRTMVRSTRTSRKEG